MTGLWFFLASQVILVAAAWLLVKALLPYRGDTTDGEAGSEHRG